MAARNCGDFMYDFGRHLGMLDEVSVAIIARKMLPATSKNNSKATLLQDGEQNVVDDTFVRRLAASRFDEASQSNGSQQWRPYLLHGFREKKPYEIPQQENDEIQ